MKFPGKNLKDKQNSSNSKITKITTKDTIENKDMLSPYPPHHQQQQPYKLQNTSITMFIDINECLSEEDEENDLGLATTNKFAAFSNSATTNKRKETENSLTPVQSFCDVNSDYLSNEEEK